MFLANFAFASGWNSCRKNGPLPAGLAKLVVPSGMMPKFSPARICGKKAFGADSWNLTVVGSGAEMPDALRKGEMFASAGEASLGFRIRVTEYATSLEVSLPPPWKVTPSRSRNDQVFASGVELQLVARAGARAKFWSARTSVS